jgi:hypothetical protein
MDACLLLEQLPSYFYLRGIFMKNVLATLIVSIALSTTAGGAAAAGCLKGAAVGGVGGHVAGHHALLGAAVGCGVGHHMAKARNAEQATESQAKPPIQPQSTK